MRYPRRRSIEFRCLRDGIEKAAPDDFDVHPVKDNDAARKMPPIRNWLTKQPKWRSA